MRPHDLQPNAHRFGLVGFAILLGFAAQPAFAQPQESQVSVSLMPPEQESAVVLMLSYTLSRMNPSQNVKLPPLETLTAPLPSPQTIDLVMAERMRYWESRGRRDLADDVLNNRPQPDAGSRNATGQDEPETELELSSETSRPEKKLVVKITAQEQEDLARYWDSRGRADLAAQVRQGAGKPERPAFGRPKPAPDKLPALSRPAPGGQGTFSLAGRYPTIPASAHSNDYSSQLDAAQTYRKSGQLTRARGQIDAILANSPDLPEALLISAQLYADQALWSETLQTLEKILPVARTPEMITLQRTAWTNVQIARADVLAKQGQNEAAQALLRDVAQELSIVSFPVAEEKYAPNLWGAKGFRR